eukprot:c16749_g1_i1 orf=1-330(-)
MTTASSCTPSFSAHSPSSSSVLSSHSSPVFCSKLSLSPAVQVRIASPDRKLRPFSITAQAPLASDGADSALLDRPGSSSSSSDAIQQFLKRDYKWGFVSDIESVSIPKGL